MKTNLMKAKWCWVANETKGGWGVKLAAGVSDFKVTGLVLATEQDVKKICKGNIVFIHRKIITTKKTVRNNK